MDLYRADRQLAAGSAGVAGGVDLCLERYPRDLRNALIHAEAGRVHEGHAVLVEGLVHARELAHPALERVYAEAISVYEARYAMAGN